MKYEQDLTTAEAEAVEAAVEGEKAGVRLTLQRTELDRFKVRADEARIAIHGKLLAFLKDKVEADTFFRPTTAAPSGDTTADDTAPAAAKDASPAPTTGAPHGDSRNHREVVLSLLTSHILPRWSSMARPFADCASETDDHADDKGTAAARPESHGITHATKPYHV